MLTFVAAYLIVWFGILVYVLRLGAKQRQLQQAVQSLQLRLEQSQQRVE